MAKKGRPTNEDIEQAQFDALLEQRKRDIEQCISLNGGTPEGITFRMNRQADPREPYKPGDSDKPESEEASARRMKSNERWEALKRFVGDCGLGEPTRHGSRTAEWDFAAKGGKQPIIRWLGPRKEESRWASDHKP